VTSRYPISEHRELRPAFRRGARQQRRDPLIAGQDETLVYRVGSQYVTGDIDPTRADAVSVVDTSHEASITVRGVRSYLGPAFDQVDIDITGVFLCTVVDPVAVVQARDTFPLRHLHRFLAEGFQAGAGFAYRPGAEGALHRVITTWLKGIPSPTPIPGMRVVHASLEVEPSRCAEA
jgi:hypothetical protein